MKSFVLILLICVIGCEHGSGEVTKQDGDREAIERFCSEIGIELDSSANMAVKQSPGGKRSLIFGEQHFIRSASGRVSDFFDLRAMTQVAGSRNLKSLEECESSIASVLRAAEVSEPLVVLVRKVRGLTGDSTTKDFAYFRLATETVNGFNTRGWGNFAEVVVSRATGKIVQFHSATGWTYEQVLDPISVNGAVERARQELRRNGLTDAGEANVTGPLYFRGNSSFGARAYVAYEDAKVVPLAFLITIKGNTVIVSAKEGQLLGGASKK